MVQNHHTISQQIITEGCEKFVKFAVKFIFDTQKSIDIYEKYWYNVFMYGSAVIFLCAAETIIHEMRQALVACRKGTYEL